MERNEDQVLAEELAALSAVGGGGGRLVRAVAKLMRKEVHEVDLVLPLPFDDAVKRVSGVLGRAGHVIETLPVRPGEDETVRIVAGGGAGGLNPVVVTARVLRADEDTSEVWLRGAAKEGLVRQRAAEKTVVLLAARLSRGAGEGATDG
ncbi:MULTISPECIES: hypothetical protein [unclassified Streptomyces]|uniref:hypothetical protein n=1 Tax=unclassified Streptomyces TaxID=2593676 RepID=UPI00093F60F3|nr:hypothetical protein [Streptomyces sp. CB02058]OKI92209.1 hypothetical protein AMK10_20725 [Streptomyces sp. CB02058]